MLFRGIVTKGDRSRRAIRLRLFCFPHGGAGASVFAEWKNAFPESIQIVPVQLPGREDRIAERPFRNPALLLDTLEAEIKNYLDIPFAFFGHSLGALIAFHLARRLRHSPPVHFLASGCRAPALPRTIPNIHHLSPGEFVEQLQRNYNTLSPMVLQEAELLDLLLPAIQADFVLFETIRYEFAPPLSCPISAFGGDADSLITRSDLESWQTETSAAFKASLFPGDHFYLKTARHALLACLNRTLAACLP